MDYSAHLVSRLCELFGSASSQVVSSWLFILLRMPHSVLSEADSFARTVVYFGDNQTIFPDHGAKEMGEGLRKKIIKDLGLKD